MTLPIAEQLVFLAELARVDQEAKTANDKLEALPAIAKKADAIAAKIKSELDGAQARKASAAAAKRSLEQEASDERIKIRKWEARANDIRGEREHAALTSEIGGAKRQIRDLEDSVLEQMESLEASGADIVKLEAKHAEATADAKSEYEKVADAVKELTGIVATLNGRKAVLLEKLPANVIKRYEQVAAKRQGVGVAVIDKNDACGACHMAVPPQLCIQVQKGQVLESCPACQRLLVHETMTAVVVAEDGASS